MLKVVEMVDIDDLGVDTRNIREGKWERDKEFVLQGPHALINWMLLPRL